MDEKVPFLLRGWVIFAVGCFTYGLGWGVLGVARCIWNKNQERSKEEFVEIVKKMAYHDEAANYALDRMKHDMNNDKEFDKLVSDALKSLFGSEARSGNAFAQYNLALAYYAIDDSKTGDEWMEKAAEGGYKEAVIHLNEKNKMIKESVELREKMSRGSKESFQVDLATAELGDAEKMYSVALCYRTGRGCEKNEEKAKYWLDRAVAGNCSGAFGIFATMANQLAIQEEMDNSVEAKIIEDIQNGSI